jgi:DnaJ-class molecular chaperone
MSWLGRQRRHEKVVLKNCKYCGGSGNRGKHLCQACRGTGLARTVYRRVK